MIATVLISLLLICSNTGPSGPAKTPAPGESESLPPIAVDVFAPPDIKQAFVEQVFAEMDAIWRPAGITVTWRRIESKSAADASRLQVAIEEGRLREAENHVALGWIVFTANQPERSIHVSVPAAEELLVEAAHADDSVVGTHDFLIERALGRALSHELGHYLLGSKFHAPRGLMRASWPPHEIFGEARHGFELTAEQRQSAAERLRTCPAPAAAIDPITI